MSYVSDVAEFVAARRGSPTILSPSEYAVIAEWEKQEIPIKLVFGIFDRSLMGSESSGRRSVSIEELDKAVYLQYADWLQNRTEAKGS